MKKLDQLLSFRDNDKFKIFAKVFSIIVVALSFAVLVLVVYYGGSGKDYTRPYVFSLLCVILLSSFFRKNDYLFLLAEFVTIIADMFLVLKLGSHVLITGFSFYIVVQLIYALYFYFRDPYKKRELVITIVRVALILLGIIALVVTKKIGDKTVLGVIYFANILMNIVCAIIFKDPILIIGFIFFAVSDTFIGLPILINNLEFTFNFVYFNYVISQVILMFNRHNNAYIKEIK